jgi:hypothetical protein
MPRRRTLRIILTLALLTGSAAFGADDPVARVYDDQVKTIEREILGLAQAMPADKYNFAPTNGTFTGVRTFALQVRHVATMIYTISASILEEKPPVDTGKTDNGPDTLATKDQIIDYFKGALAYAHKAVGSLTQKNMLDPVPSPFGRGTMQRMAAAGVIAYHSYDHYGQMVVYGRMNGVIPGAGPRTNPATSTKAK